MTSPENWKKIKSIFNEAVELPTADRFKFTRDRCGDDAEAWAELQILLDSVDDAANFIEEPIFAAAASYIGTMVGNYRIVREIGRGGMGVVLLAEREGADFRQQVAVKILKRGIDSDEIVRRFSQERQILASLNHPNIAGLIDGGTTQDGLPYFVMEYVNGLPLIKYCEQNASAEVEKIRLFRDVCSAVSYAHGRLVVHRDLKPSNILVTNDGLPKLLDFGIAKLLDDDDGVNRLTQTSNRLLTPEYASPEQIRGLEITTSSDVYSLGVILYELLTGSLPYVFETRSAEEVFRVICEVEPVSPDKLSAKRIDADLKNIVLMALRKEPDRRYNSVEKLRDDLRRYEANLPVTARPDTWKYRSSKFARRNRVAVAAGVLVFISLLGGIIATAWQATIARRERDRSAAEAKRSAALNRFLQSILVSPDPEQDGKDVKIVEILAAAVQRASDEYSDQPELKADALYSIGRTYVGLGQNEAAEPVLREAMALNTVTRGADDENTFRATTQLAACLSELNRYPETIQLLTDAIPRGRRLFPKGNSDLAFALTTLGETSNRAGDPEKAKAALLESIEIYRATEGENGPNFVETMLSLARIREFTNDYAGAESDEREILRISRNLPDKYNIRTANVLSNLGNILRINGKYEEAGEMLRESVARSAGVQGESYGAAQARNYLARLYLETGDLKNAEIEARTAVETMNAIKTQNYVTHLATAALGLALTRMGKTVEGESLVRKAVADEQNSQPRDQRHVAVIQMALGECLFYQAKFAASETELIPAHAMLQKSFGDGNAYTRQSARDLIALYDKWQMPEKAQVFRNADSH